VKFLIVYGSINGNTEKMAGYIAEGIRFTGNEVDVKPFPEVREPEDFAGYDGFLFGGPTYHKDLLHGMKAWLFKAKEAGLAGKFGGAFGSHTHSGEAPGLLYDTMAWVFDMNMLDLAPFKMEERVLGTAEGLKACQQFGKAVAERAST
jgi:flavodoxin